jgi:hypothetical protein
MSGRMTGVRTARSAARAVVMMTVLLGTALSTGASTTPAAAQIIAPPAPRAEIEPGSQLTVYLMTMGEGDLVYERFGHNALWIHDPVAGTDNTYHWGVFDFDEPGFLWRFIRGRMWYAMEAFPAFHAIQAYPRMNRSVWIQELNLTPAQRRELVDFLEWNRLPENRSYRYDYYYDNCSTRLRDALDRALGGQIRAQTVQLPARETFRSHTRRVTTNAPITYTGLMIGLGQGVDHPITVWEEMFLPLSMRESVRHLTVTGPDGTNVPLVLSEQALFLADRPPLRQAPPRWWPGYLLLGLVLAGLLLGLGHVAARSRAARAALAAVGGGWTLITGLLGLVLTFLWGFTDHAAAYHNENLFHFNLLALPLAALFPALVHGPARPALNRATVALAGAVAALSGLGLLLKPLPAMFQVNGELIALVLPVHAALAIVAFLLTRQARA